MLWCRHSSRPAAADLRRQAAGGRPDAERLQHPEGVDAPPGAASARRREEAQEEELHDPEEEQAQEEEGQAGRTQVLSGACRSTFVGVHSFFHYLLYMFSVCCTHIVAIGFLCRVGDTELSQKDQHLDFNIVCEAGRIMRECPCMLSAFIWVPAS